ncbi:unnamed protein product, partial [Didymodactylos carnosus]
DKEDIVSEVKRVLEQQLGFDKTGRRENLSKSQRKAIKTLKEDENIIIIPADKGGKVVVMNVEDYIKKIKEKLDTKAYQKLDEDPSKDRDEMNMMLENKKLPFVRGQLKVHKQFFYEHPSRRSPNKQNLMNLVQFLKEKYDLNLIVFVRPNYPDISNVFELNYNLLFNKIFKSKIPALLYVRYCEEDEPLDKWSQIEDIQNILRQHYRFEDIISM